MVEWRAVPTGNEDVNAAVEESIRAGNALLPAFREYSNARLKEVYETGTREEVMAAASVMVERYGDKVPFQQVN